MMFFAQTCHASSDFCLVFSHSLIGANLAQPCLTYSPTFSSRTPPIARPIPHPHWFLSILHYLPTAPCLDALTFLLTSYLSALLSPLPPSSQNPSLLHPPKSLLPSQSNSSSSTTSKTTTASAYSSSTYGRRTSKYVPRPCRSRRGRKAGGPLLTSRKILLNPFHTVNTPIRNPGFEAKIKQSAKRNL